MEDKDIARLADRMRALCSRREYCRSEIMKKALTGTDGDREAAEKIVMTLVAEKYIDDLRYASAYARDKSSIAGWGETKIRYMLASKGIAKDDIAAALETVDDDRASDKLRRIVEAKAKALAGDPQIRLKLLRFALGRGYSYDEANERIELILKKNE